MKTYTIFLVSQKNLDSIQLLDAAFDTKEKAEAYANRFKTNMEPDITEITVNPPYCSDVSQDCYYVEMDFDGSEAESYVVNTLEGSKSALQDFKFLDDRFRTCGYVIAENPEEAVQKVLSKSYLHPQDQND